MSESDFEVGESDFSIEDDAENEIGEEEEEEEEFEIEEEEDDEDDDDGEEEEAFGEEVSRMSPCPFISSIL